MKKHLLLALSMLVAIACQKAMAQASTEGKDFWVALGLANAPGGDISAFNPFIAISAKKACTVQLSAPAGNWVDQPRQIQADSWTIIDDIPDNVWYNTNWNANSANEQTNPYGILVQASEDVSVYAAMRMEYSYDASNILPVTAIQSEYMLQDYPTFNSEGDAHSVFVICATEDNTTVDINLSTPSIGGRAANTPYNITLAHKGQTYQVVSTNTKSFSGTTVKARNNKKIAVFSGADFTQVPGGKSARDCLYEQAMPVDYWGNEFVVTRSVERDANRVRITALEDGTDIRIDNRHVTFLNAGETYEFEISEDLAPTIKEIHTKAGRDIPDIYNGIAHYIQTSCPCAVFSYDVSSDYRFSETTKIGDPSMVWIAPLQQRINKITFGACGTAGTSGHTNRHYVDIVCLTSDIATFHLKSDQRANIPVTFISVPGNTQYSYAQLFLVDTDQPNPDKVYTMSNKTGFVAHVYGSGTNESYAYSCGSAAVKRAINLEGFTFTDGLRGENRFCINTPLTFDAQVGTDIIDKVDWDFGDGVTEYNAPAQTTHEYETKGWYDVIANVYAHKDCPETVYPAEAVHFSFYVDKAEIIKHETSMCVPWDSPIATDTISDTIRYDCDSIVINSTFVRRESKPTDVDITAKDSFLLHGSWIYETGNYPYTFKNSQNCDSVVTYRIKVVHCLDINVPTEVNPECDGHTSIYIPYDYHKGEIAAASFVTTIDGQEKTYPMTVSGSTFLLDVSDFTPGTVTGRIDVRDDICTQVVSFPITVFVRLPNSIMHQKYDNVVGVTLEAIKKYDFRGYRWLLDGEEQLGQRQSIYYQEQGFTSGQYVEVLILLPNGKWIQSCKLNMAAQGDMNNPFRPEEEAQKVIRRGNIYIQMDGHLYNTLGEKID